jgi:hypothetical protein
MDRRLHPGRRIRHRVGPPELLSALLDAQAGGRAAATASCACFVGRRVLETLNPRRAVANRLMTPRPR